MSRREPGAVVGAGLRRPPGPAVDARVEPDPAQRPWWRTLLAIVVATAAKVFWEPIRDGSPRWRTWPKGLRTIALLCGIAYVVAAGLVLGSAWIRAHDPLVHFNGDTYPSWATTVLLWLTILVLSLSLTAALHTQPVVSVLTLVYIGVTLAFPALATGHSPAYTIGALVGLVVFFALRARRRFAWFEFPVVLALVAISVYAPIAALPFGAGFDLRPLYVGMLVGAVTALAVPVLLMAGYAPAEVAVRLSEWLLNRMSVETARSRWRWLVLGGGVAVASAVFVLDVGGGLLRAEWDFRAEALGASALVVGVSLGWCWLMLRRRPGRPPTRPTPETWEPYAWPLAVIWVAAAIPLGIVIVVGAALSTVGLPQVLDFAQDVSVSDRFFGTWRLVTCAVAVWWLIRARRRGERVAPVLLVCFVALTLLGAARQVTGGLAAVPWSLPGVVAVAVGVSLLAVVVAVIRRRGVERQLWIALLALVLSALVGRGELLAEPGSLAAGVSGLAVVLLGLVWRVLTDAGITRGHSRWFPMPTRVLFFAANALLGALVLAHLALTRQENPAIDVETMAGAGLNAVGAPLVLGAILLGLLSTIGLNEPSRGAVAGTLRSSPPDEKTVIRDPYHA